MSDTFMKSFNQGLNLAHTIEQDKRLQQQMMMQQQLQMVQLQKMAQEMAADQHIQSDSGLRGAVSSQFEDPVAAETAMKGGVPFSKLKSVMPVKQNRQPMTFENLLVEQVRSGQMTLQDAMKAKQANKEFNIPAEVDTFLMTQFPDYASNPETRSKASSWMATDEGRAAYKKFWTEKKTTGPPIYNVLPGYQTPQGQPAPFNVRTGAIPQGLQKTPSESDVKEARTFTGITAVIDEVDKAFKEAEAALPKDEVDRVTGYAGRISAIKTQSNPKLVNAAAMADTMLAKFARAAGEVGTLTDMDIKRAEKMKFSIHDTPAVRADKKQKLTNLYTEIYNRGKRQENPLGPNNPVVRGKVNTAEDFFKKKGL